MITQIPDRLVNRFSAIELGELELYGVIRGELLAYDGSGVTYAYRTRPPMPEKRSSSLLRGYVATIVLHEDARLEVMQFEEPFVSPKTSLEVSEFLEGNGWLRMGPHFAWPKVFLPFRDGRIVGDESQWVLFEKTTLAELRFPAKGRDWFEWREPKHERLAEPALAARVSRSFSRTDVSGGLWVELDAPLPVPFEWSRFELRRAGKLVTMVRAGASTGEPGGAWLLFGLNDRPVGPGDELWAVDARS